MPHNANATNLEDDKSPSPVPEEEITMSAESGEKSVLQAKLTNLAIQIGYGGNGYILLGLNVPHHQPITHVRLPAVQNSV